MTLKVRIALLLYTCEIRHEWADRTDTVTSKGRDRKVGMEMMSE